MREKPPCERAHAPFQVCCDFFDADGPEIIFIDGENELLEFSCGFRKRGIDFFCEKPFSTSVYVVPRHLYMSFPVSMRSRMPASSVKLAPRPSTMDLIFVNTFSNPPIYEKCQPPLCMRGIPRSARTLVAVGASFSEELNAGPPQRSRYVNGWQKSLCDKTTEPTFQNGVVQQR